ncbi:hypothetical protein DRQ50_14030 [bacterium]|nr:MAG: hypothetical protein DRQ50_14030 [bacterium]
MLSVPVRCGAVLKCLFPFGCVSKIVPGVILVSLRLMSYDITTQAGFRPKFCPNPNCNYHKGISPDWKYKKAGYYERLAHPRRIQRFTCLHCKRSFSSQTFSTTYWQKDPELNRLIFMKTIGGMCHRQIARDLGISPETVEHHVGRIGRHCMLLHTVMMPLGPPPTNVVIDGFETFEWSQYFPFHHNLAIEKGVDFMIYFNDSELRRKGRMTKTQRTRRTELEQQHGRPDPKAIRNGIADLLDVVCTGSRQVTIDSDDHPSYRQPIRKMGDRVIHRVTPGSAKRTKDNNLWEANLADLVLRHSSANHKRETISWSKRRQNSSERLAIYLVWRNYMKGRREKERGSPTPAMVRGMLDRPLTVDDILGERLFATRIELPSRWRKYYDKRVVTRAMGRQRVHELKYAY